MAVEVMSRRENKYLISPQTYEALLRIVDAHMALDPYNRNGQFYTISNVYYDTPCHDLIRRSQQKPKYKEKLRLRGYGVPAADDTVYLEIKKKFCGTVNKRRTALPISAAYDFLTTCRLPDFDKLNPQIAKELTYSIGTYNAEPKVYIAYDRLAFSGEDGLRVTFDTNIRTRRYDLRLEAGDYGEPLVQSDVWLLETKTAGALPLWLVQAFSSLSIYAGSFSKYGTEYTQYLQKGGALCLTPSLASPKTPFPSWSHGSQPFKQLA